MQHLLAKFILPFIMLSVQYGSVVHSAEHFHHHDHHHHEQKQEQDISCEAFIAAERLADTSLQCAIIVPIRISTPVCYQKQSLATIESATPRPRSRSPPTVFS